MFKRKQAIQSALAPKRALLIYGPRRIGKTTMLKEFLESEQRGRRVKYVVGDDATLRDIFKSEERERLLDFAAAYDTIGIDEAQQVPSIGLGTKMIVDANPEKVIVLTGSSSFDLAQEVTVPLTGRHFSMALLPISLSEMGMSRFELEGALPDLLVYGAYPEVLNAPSAALRQRFLKELVASYLFKEALALERLKSPDLLAGIARAVAFQVGSEVSLNEVAMTTNTDVKTVARYLDLLEKMFIIKRVRGLSRNLRNEISKKAKYYFLDNGVRNAIIDSFAPITTRGDIGALWENFVLMELYKQSAIADRGDRFYFWRTHAGAEIDIVRESGGALAAFECKWNGTAKVPTPFAKAYPGTPFTVVNRDSYLDLFV